MRTLPTALNDGSFDYVMVREAQQLEDGRENVALYDSVPMNDDYQFTPCLDYVLGKVTVPTMIPIKR